MKYIITESQYKKVILEQPEEKFDTPANKEFLRTGKYPTDKDFVGLGIDDTIDVLSAFIDGIPGIGNLVSLGIDLSHTLSYLIRYSMTNESEVDKKIEYGTLAFITLTGSLIPVGGNSLPIVARKGISEILKQTPKEIIQIANSLGLYNKAVIFLSKSKWKYSLLLVLAKIFGGELGERLTDINKKLYSMYNSIGNIPFFKQIIMNTIKDINSLKQDAPLAIQLSSHLK